MKRSASHLAIILALTMTGCGLIPSASTRIEELEAEIARCLRIPADHVTVILNEDGALEELVMHVPRGRDDVSPDAAGQRCLQAIGLEGL